MAKGQHGRNKGRGYEIAVAKAVGLWWDGDGEAFWRNVGSGNRTKKGFVAAYSGDIIPVQSKAAKGWRLHVECKKQEGWAFEDVPAQRWGSASIWSFIAQTVYDSEISHRTGICIMSRNRNDWYVFLPLHQWWDHPQWSEFVWSHNLLMLHATKELMQRYQKKYHAKRIIQLDGYVVRWNEFQKFFSRRTLVKWLKVKSRAMKKLPT